MKTMNKLGLLGLSVGAGLFLAGCGGIQPVKVDYPMPARAVSDVTSVNVSAIRVNAEVTGNCATDNAQSAALVKQLLAMRLYKEGYYQVADDLWCAAEGATKMADILKLTETTGHGYGTYSAAGQGKEKAVLEVNFKVELNAKPVEKKVTFKLQTIPYVREPAKPGKAPISKANMAAMVVEDVEDVVTVYETEAMGTLTARFVGMDGGPAPVEYSNTFAIEIPEAERGELVAPTPLKVLAAALTPAVNNVVADISPYREVREINPVDGGDLRVLSLLQATAFAEAISLVEHLELAELATAEDFENQGLAFEAIGDFNGAKFAYEKAIKLGSSGAAEEGLERIEKALQGKKEIKQSAELNKLIKL